MSLVKRVDKAEWEKDTAPYVCVTNEPLGARVLATSNEWFAEASNLIKPGPPIVEVRFVPTGRWYDGWETRRHNPEPSDWTVIELGVKSARILGVEIDTAHFSGNHAPAISVEGSSSADGPWEPVVGKIKCGPSQQHFFLREQGLTEKAYSHLRLHMYPDGGIARFRAWGQPVPVFPASKSEVIDMAALGNGGVAIACSDQHFSSADNLLLPGRGTDMSDGWETARSREPGHVDWVIVKLGAPTIVHQILVDTAFFRGNFPQSVRVEGLSAKDNAEALAAAPDAWSELVPRSVTGPDKEHVYTVTSKTPVSHVRFIMIPDGGAKRLRVFGERV